MMFAESAKIPPVNPCPRPSCSSLVCIATHTPKCYFEKNCKKDKRCCYECKCTCEPISPF
ncbi:UNVERIFIED_CONTAM: hypothetical protein RMT77_008263 [Armadillidium vulgare]